MNRFTGLALAAAVLFGGCAARKTDEVRAPEKGGTGSKGGTELFSAAGSPGAEGAAAAVWKRTEAKVRIRLHNLDSLLLKDVLVGFPSDSARFPLLPGKGYTDYVAVDSAYRYAYIRSTSQDGLTWVCQPTDYVSERLLAPGRYTYEIARVGLVDSSLGRGFLRLQLVEDKEHP
jgi:hypothetical protein